MHYIDGYVIPVPTKNLNRYREMAQIAGRVWMKHGAIRYVEAIIEDPSQQPFGLPFPRAFDVRPDETAVFSYVMFRTREARDAVNKKVMDDKDMKQMGERYADVFDCHRMAYSGFEVIVEM